MALLYRGVPANTVRGIDALNGIVKPRGRSKNYTKHVRGESIAAEVTSWSYRKDVAESFGDIILVVDEVAVSDRIVPHPLPKRYPHEREVLIRGELTGVYSYQRS